MLDHSWTYIDDEDGSERYQCEGCKLIVHKPDFLSLEQALYYEGILSLCLTRIMESHKEYVRIDDGCGH